MPSQVDLSLPLRPRVPAQNIWHLPAAPEAPTDPYTGKDMRNISTRDDTPDREVPWSARYTSQYFGDSFGVMEKAGIKFTAGDLLGPDPEGRTMADNISHLRHYEHPSKTTLDMRSATSRGHDIFYSRPPTVCPGWGAYDQFADWQARGRRLSPDMVKPLNWDDPRPVTLVSQNDLNTPVLTLDSKFGISEEDDDDFKTPESLWFKFELRKNGKISRTGGVKDREAVLPLPTVMDG